MRIVYFNLVSGFRIYDIDNKTFDTWTKFPDTVIKYSMFRGYELSDEGLLRFAQDFLKWCGELNTAVKGYLKIDYLAYWSHAIAVESTFKRISGSHDFEKVDRLENGYMNLCNNGG